MKTDYPELEGRRVWIPAIKKYGVVAGCNYNIGITIQVEGDNKQKACLIGQSAPVFKQGKIEPFKSQMTYRVLFHEWVRQIKNGVFGVKKIKKMTPEYGISRSISCPYSS